MDAIPIPLASCADHMLGGLARATGSPSIAALDGATLLGERAMLGDFAIPGRVSAGGGCRLYETRDGLIALNLARPADRELLPALFETDGGNVEQLAAQLDTAWLIERGRLLGLAISGADEALSSPSPCVELAAGPPATRDGTRPPRVLDLSALWAGPLAAHLLWLAGAEVVKVESRSRPDAMRDGDKAFYQLLNQGKASVAIDFADAEDRRALLALIAACDIVIEAARPRGLAQLGIDAEAIVRATPGLVWITITGHGAAGESAHWVGFGDDCGVAGGLTAALRSASGSVGFVGDAIADPLTGLWAANAGWKAWSAGRGGRFGLAMSHVAASCLRDEAPEKLEHDLRAWAASAGKPFPPVQRREAGALAGFGADTPILARARRLMLIRRAELEGGTIADVRIARDRIAAMGELAAGPGEPVIEANGGLLLPGLHDHHIHVAALAASLTSVRCGPPEVNDSNQLINILNIPGEGWLRGIGYHESVAGVLDRRWLDKINRDRPLRIQHRSGRMWFFNSAGLDAVLAGRTAPAGLERETGRLFDEDRWLREALASKPPGFAQVGTLLARAGVTGVTDMSVGNDAAIARHFAAQHISGALPQRVLLAGTLDLADVEAEGIGIGPAKLHLHEAHLPALGDALDFIGEAHATARAVAIHCVTEVELVFALALLSGAGVEPGDRIEHASVAPDTAVEEIARLGLAVCSQPHFIDERGDLYLREVEPRDQPHLYRLRAFLDAKVTLAGGSDAPFGSADPWAAMAAAVSRRTAQGAPIGASEALTAEEALDLYLRVPASLARRRTVTVGAPADLCLLDRPRASARIALSADLVRATLIGGRIVYDRIDQAPA